VLEVNSGMLQDGDDVAACSNAGVEAVVCSDAGDKAPACSGTEIEDSRWRRQKSESTWRFLKIAKCDERECMA
jgi:hypothetical protein